MTTPLQIAWLAFYKLRRDYRAMSVPIRTRPYIRELAFGEIAVVIGAGVFVDSPTGPRHTAMIAFLSGAGLRRSEAVSLDLSNYQNGTRPLVIRGAKGRKDRIGYAINGSDDPLTDWCQVRCGDNGSIYCCINKEGRSTIRRLTDQAVLPILERVISWRLFLFATPTSLEIQ